MLANVYVSADVMVSDDLLSDLIPTLPYLGNGISRKVYDLGDGTVLKVNSGGIWAGNCRTEAETWEDLSTTDAARYLAPVLAVASDGSWLVMVKVSYVGYEDREEYESLRRILNRHGISDLHDANIGVTADGRHVAIDYAFVSDLIESSDDEDATCRCTDCVHPQECREIMAHCSVCVRIAADCGRTINTCGEHPCFDCHDECTCQQCADDVLLQEEYCQCGQGLPTKLKVWDLPIVGRVVICNKCTPNVNPPFTNWNKLFLICPSNQYPKFVTMGGRRIGHIG